jgi:hypothetical protein
MQMKRAIEGSHRSSNRDAARQQKIPFAEANPTLGVFLFHVVDGEGIEVWAFGAAVLAGALPVLGVPVSGDGAGER